MGKQRRDAAGIVPESAGTCFHCGLPLPQPAFPVMLDEVVHETCCRGCQAVAETIIRHGLASYYRQRSVLPATPEAPEKTLRDLGLYDLPETQRDAVRDVPGQPEEKEAALLVDGITCAACVWLIEQRVMRLAGVSSIAINYATRRATVRWDARRTSLSEILTVIAQIGYAAQPYDPDRSDASLRRERRGLLLRLFVAGFGMMQVMMYAFPAYIADGAMTADIEQLMRLASLVLTTPVALWAALPFYEGAWRDLRNRRWGMDVPVSIGILSAYLASANATVRGSGDVYFDSVSMFVFLLLAARFLELGARSKAAREQERLVRLTPAIAERLTGFPEANVVEQVPTVALRAGDHVLVRPGARIPADGAVAAGRSTVDEAVLTGESRPVEKNAGDRLTAGATNLDSPLTLRVERVGEETAVAGIMRLMDRAQ
ncbi:MAG TPA: heavy metal translocating P-type ATPase metal-binding domain-containing protein, partial [Burkholderiales bacterium]|nr:heavy metal translocating P-type ATPase metal-binding domain-containing protein [Burkholderiales bacterium]